MTLIGPAFTAVHGNLTGKLTVKSSSCNKTLHDLFQIYMWAWVSAFVFRVNFLKNCLLQSLFDKCWQDFHTCEDLSTAKYQICILSDPRMCLTTSQILSYHIIHSLPWEYHDTIMVLSEYCQDTIKLS